MDFHALPRRDLQALCKRNSIRANTTNAAMADALSALPAVDGIEEYVKQPAAEPTHAANPAAAAVADDEKQGIMQEDVGKDKRGLKRDEHKDTVPALGLGRCALVEPVVAPATKRRAAASKTEAGSVAPEAVLVPASRRRAAVSKTEPMATRRRKAAASQAKAEDVVKEAVPVPTTRELSQTAVDLVAEEKVPRARRTARKALVTKADMQREEEGEGPQGVISDVKTAVPAPVSDDGEGRDEPDDMEEAINPEIEQRNEVAEESVREEEATPVEEEPPLAEDCADNSSVHERLVDVEQREDLQIVLGLVEQKQCASFRDIAGIGEGTLDDEVVHHANEETKMVPVKEEARAMLKLVPATKNVNEGPSFSEVLHTAAKANEAGTKHGVLLEEKEALAVREVLQDTHVAVEEEVVLVTDEMPQSSATVNVNGLDVFTVNDLTQLTASDVEAEEGDLLLQEKESLAVDEVVVDTDAAFQDKGVLSTDNMQGSATVNVDVEEEVFTVDHFSELVSTEEEGAGGESAFTSDLPPVFGGVHGTSPFSAGMLGDITKSVSMDSDAPEAKVPEEAIDVPPCMYINSNEKNIAELVATKSEKEGLEVSKSKEMGNLSLRKLRLILKETVAVGQGEEGKKKSMESIPLEPYVSEEAGDASLCVYNNSNEKNITESVPVKQDKEVKKGNKSEAVGDLSLRKHRLQLKEKMAVGQENEGKEGKKSMALDTLSLRKLRIKLKETLNAHKSRGPNRAALGRLDENVC